MAFFTCPPDFGLATWCKIARLLFIPRMVPLFTQNGVCDRQIPFGSWKLSRAIGTSITQSCSVADWRSPFMAFFAQPPNAFGGGPSKVVRRLGVVSCRVKFGNELWKVGQKLLVTFKAGKEFELPFFSYLPDGDKPSPPLPIFIELMYSARRFLARYVQPRFGERLLRPQLRHTSGADRMAGIGFGQFARFECPVSGNCAAPRRAKP